MDEEENTNETTGPRGNMTANTTIRSIEKTCTQKLSIPILEKYDPVSVKLWWRKFIQYVKMTQDIDITTMVNSREILPRYREQLEEDIKDIFIWAIGQTALTEMTKTVREREPTNLSLYRHYALFRLLYTPERNKHHSRANFFQLKREPGESASDLCKRILEAEQTASLKR